MQNSNPKFKNFIFIGIIFIFAFFSFHLVFENAKASGTANFQIEIFYAKESHQIDTTSSFTETLSNPNNSSFEINSPADVLSSGEAIELTMYSTPEESVTIDKPLPSGKLGADIFYNISFKKVSDNSTVSSFDKAVTLTFYYTDSDISGIDESTLTAYRWNGSAWTALSDSAVDTSLNKVTATTQQFSDFALIGNASPSCGDGSCNGSETCSSCPTDCGACDTGGGGGGGGGGGALPTSTTNKVILQGKASPAAYLTALKDGQVIVNTQANSQADFKVEISNLTAGIYTFGIWAEDKNGVRSITFSFTVNVVSGATTTIGGIFIPPTIDLSKDSVRKGEILNILGQTAPEAEVEIHINSNEIVETVIAASSGNWFYNLDTGQLEEGVHSARAKASTVDGLLSTFSQIKLFGVGVGIGIIKEADINNDKKVNLVDFSILLYNWGVPKNPMADLNNDGQVDLIDFSIMLYWWTG